VTIAAIAADRLEDALRRLIRAGYRVAVIEPTDAETARTVKREMQRALIPGTLRDD
jgi:DNA mismatch repair ATPase MutS